MSDTVYIKISQSTEVHEPEVRVKDIAQVHCRNKAAEARIKALKVTSFKERDREASYVGSVMDLLEELEGTGSSIQINSVGETDFIVSYNPQIKRRAALQWMKTAFVSAVSFCGAAFAIMTFNNDANVTDVFEIFTDIIGRAPGSRFWRSRIQWGFPWGSWCFSTILLPGRSPWTRLPLKWRCGFMRRTWIRP
ncbi:MAG: stage V sporulation protein AA [Enterocloster sp.]